jgi:hypothetical protein
MAPLGKERVFSLTPSVATTSATVAIIAGNTFKTPISKIFKSDLFVESRFKFKSFYTQMRLGIWADNRRPIEKRIIRYTDEYIL